MRKNRIESRLMRSHGKILIRQSNENRTSFDFESTFRFDFRLLRSHDTILVESESNGKVEWKIGCKIAPCECTFENNNEKRF